MRWTDDDETFTMSTVVTNAVCASDGKVVVHHNGNENLYNFMYALEPVDGKKFRIDLKLGNTLEGIPPGRYAVVVQAFYKREGTTGGNPVFERRQEVTITGNYKSIDVSLNAKYSRNSYPCGTGIMAFNASGGLGTSKYRFIMTQAPEGVSVPQDLKVKYINYPDKYFAVEGESYLPGDYAVVVTDGCGGDTLKFTIKELREVPRFNYGNNESVFGWWSQSTPKGFDCSHVVVGGSGLEAKTAANKDDVLKHYEAGFYEVAVVPKGQTPTTWHVKQRYKPDPVVDISPLTIDQVYSNSISLKKMLTVYVRVKGCAELVESFDAGIKKESMGWVTGPGTACMKYKAWPYMVTSSGKYNGMLLCFPMRVTVKEVATGKVVTENLMMRSHKDRDTVELEYNKEYRYAMYDAKGALYTEGRYVYKADFSAGKQEVCGKLSIKIYDNNAFKNCRPFKVLLYEKKDGAYELVETKERSSESFTPFEGLSYNTDYKMVYDLPNIEEAFRTYAFKEKRNVSELRFWQDKRNLAKMNIIVTGLSELSSGSRRHVTLEGPEHFHFEWDDNPEWSHADNIYQGYFPKGKYKATVVDECGTRIIEGEYKEGYRTEGFRIETKYECTALIVKPYGEVYQRGYKEPSVYFFILSGTAPYPKKDYRAGEEIRLENLGKYKLCIVNEVGNADKRGGIDTIDIDYSRPELTLDTDHTLAYACVDGEDGHIFVKGKTGVGQFHYTLWQVDAKGDTVMVRDRETDVTNGIAHFQYGKAHDRVIVKVHDDCSNFKWYPLTISDRTNLKIASSPKPEICTGETIVLRCMKLSQDDDGYEWYDPSGKLISTKAEVEIPKADAKLSGNYRVVVHPLYCGNGIEGYVFIQVHPCFAPINPHLMQRCVQQKQ